MVAPTIDPERGRVGIGFEVAGIGKAGISIGNDSIGGKIGIGPVSVEVGTGSASGFESLEWDFGVAKQKTTQTGCTITRESWIAGVGIIDSETWTDPRCELPPTPVPAPTPTLKPGDFSPIIPAGMNSNSADYCMVLVGEIMIQSGSHRDPATGKLIRTYNNGATASLTIKNKPDKITSLNTLIPLVTGTAKSFGNEEVFAAYTIGVQDCINTPVGKMNYEASLKPNYYQAGYYPGGVVGYPMTSDQTVSSSGYSDLTCVTSSGATISGVNFFTGFAWSLGVFGIFFLGAESTIKKYIADGNTILANQAKAEFDRSGNTHFRQSVISDIIKVGNSLPLPATPPPNPPPQPMDKACCAMIAEVHQVLATKEMLRGKCTFPWRLRMPGGQGDEKILDYANYLRALAQEIDHLGLHPMRLYIQDNNNAQEGDQTVDIQYPSATSAFEALMRQVWDDNADGDTRTNFLYRLAWLGIQNSEMTLKLSAKVHALCEALGVETEVDTAEFPVPFNTAAGVREKSTRGKGFGEKEKPKPGSGIDKSIDANTELAVEKLLPDFLRCRDNQVLIERFSGDKDIKDILSLILMHVEKLNSK